MAIKVLPYLPDASEKWDAFVRRADGGTLFHRLGFLAYHGDKFGSVENLAWYKGESLFGVMPAAVLREHERGRAILCSPYGASYGGPVFLKPPGYSESCDVVTALVSYLKEKGAHGCRLTLPVSCCYKMYSETFRLVLLENGFRCVNRDISSVVCLAPENVSDEIMTSRARNMVRKAKKEGVAIKPHAPLKDFWAVMEKTFEKIKKAPAHTFNEFQWLCRRFPEEIYVDVAYYKDAPVAGIGYFVLNSRVNSSFYLCQDAEFQHLQAQSLLVYEALIESQKKGFRWFDFGTSSAKMKGRENLFRFKESFSAVGLFRETYEWSGNEK